MTTTDTTTSPYAARAARGAAYLDAHRPGWRERVDLGGLDMFVPELRDTEERPDGAEGPCGCVLAWAAGGYHAAIRSFTGVDSLTAAAMEWSAGHGFMLADFEGYDPLAPDGEDQAWAALTAAWREVLAHDHN